MSDKAKTTKNILMGILNHREVRIIKKLFFYPIFFQTNFVITSLIGLSTIYIFFISIFDGNLFHPLRNETTPFKSTFEKTFNNNVTSAPAAAGEESLQTHQQLSNDSLNHSSNSESPINGTNNSSTAKNDTSIIRGEAISSTERNLSSKEEERTSQFYIASFFSFFILWVLALACGYLINCFGLPHLLGRILFFIQNYKFIFSQVICLLAQHLQTSRFWTDFCP